MRSRNVISSLFYAFLGLVFLAGSTGIKLIVHECDECRLTSTSAGLYLSPPEHEDSCCDDTGMACKPATGASQESSCCQFSMEELKITDYTPAFPAPLSAPAELPARFVLHDPDLFHHPVPVPRDFPDRHGGRFLLICNCQFLS